MIGADEYVTWEIAPALLADGRVIDLWLHGGGTPPSALTIIIYPF